MPCHTLQKHLALLQDLSEHLCGAGGGEGDAPSFLRKRECHQYTPSAASMCHPSVSSAAPMRSRS